MENLTIRRHPTANLCRAVNAERDGFLVWQAAIVSVEDGNGDGFLLSRDEALELAEELWAAALDA